MIDDWDIVAVKSGMADGHLKKKIEVWSVVEAFIVSQNS